MATGSKRRISGEFLGKSGSLSCWTLRDDWLILSLSHKRALNGSWSGGGPFACMHYYRTTQAVMTPRWKRYGIVSLPKPVWSVVGFTDYPPSRQFTQPSSYYAATLTNDARVFGSTGFARAKPGRPVASAFVFAAELRDLPRIPLLLYQRLRKFRELGSEYLNIEFGWRPFLADLIKFYQAQQTMGRRLRYLQTMNGKGIRKRLTVRDTRSLEVQANSTLNVPFGAGFAGNIPANWAPSGSTTHYRTREVGEKVTFSARFRFWIPDIESPEWPARAKRALFGANPTPGALWDAIPWSWLIGWGTNLGNVLEAISSTAADNVVADYAFVMHEKFDITKSNASTYWAGLPYNADTELGPGSLSVSGETGTVTRARAAGSPFGFGITFDSLSARQVAILAALGLSRGNF